MRTMMIMIPPIARGMDIEWQCPYCANRVQPFAMHSCAEMIRLSEQAINALRRWRSGKILTEAPEKARIPHPCGGGTAEKGRCIP